MDFESFKMLVENMGKGQTGFAFILNREGHFQIRGRTRSSSAHGHLYQLSEIYGGIQ